MAVRDDTRLTAGGRGPSLTCRVDEDWAIRPLIGVFAHVESGHPVASETAASRGALDWGTGLGLAAAGTAVPTHAKHHALAYRATTHDRGSLSIWPDK